ncbi:MAG TPA: LLM class flavin-dependent oxidoreductase [Candidatus Dormibacteraeota bacterium]|jgi:alkanesulfonate monooxygenase SsuD/methylene tetrahydromethanopterin reductase-like flavin-dependent oxidoreductase (luciferase family)|nr:LLM class flavin-dependent oxidoreductase [Candidatus Dormibacteraeota bacterium]
MDVGLQMIFASYGWNDVSDEQAWDEELRLARLAADLGFDVLWSVEHHGNDYSFCPDNLQLMSYLAAECPEVGLGTAAVILPWHDPLRVAEQASVLDHLSRGRLRLGIGRGLARREFEAFRGTMDESRGRFDEAAEMILRGLRTGFMEGDGPFYPQPRTEIRPRPKRSFDDRVYAVASSDDSVTSAARINARIVMFADRPWPIRMPAIQKHRDLVRKIHGKEAGPPLLADFCVCTPTMDGAEETARRYMGKFVESNFYHYELLGPHFATVKGYDAYAQKIAMAREIGMDGIVSAFMQAAVWGTPDRILRTLEERRALVGAFELATSFRFGGTPLDLAESGLRLYAKEVLPIVQSWAGAGPAGGSPVRE